MKKWMFLAFSSFMAAFYVDAAASHRATGSQPQHGGATASHGGSAQHNASQRGGAAHGAASHGAASHDPGARSNIPGAHTGNVNAFAFCSDSCDQRCSSDPKIKAQCQRLCPCIKEQVAKLQLSRDPKFRSQRPQQNNALLAQSPLYKFCLGPHSSTPVRCPPSDMGAAGAMGGDMSSVDCNQAKDQLLQEIQNLQSIVSGTDAGMGGAAAGMHGSAAAGSASASARRWPTRSSAS